MITKIWQLVARKLSDEASPEELKELEALLQEDPALAYQIDIYCHYFNLPLLETDRATNSKEESLTLFRQQFEREFGTRSEKRFRFGLKPKIERRWFKKWAVPATGVMIIAVTIFFLTENKSTHLPLSRNAHKEVNTLPGVRSRTILPDGSLVWLNANSKVEYDLNFSGNTRELHLEGEAYFDVVKDNQRPFIIHTKTIDIKVLGTAFNVRSYQDENNTETALFRGSVEITLRNKPDKKIILKPNEKIKISNKSDEGTDNNTIPAAEKNDLDATFIKVSALRFLEKDSSALDALWINNKLVFDEEPLELVAKKIERWYNVNVKIENDALGKATYSAIFENENIEQVMEALRISGNFRYIIDKNVITIR